MKYSKITAIVTVCAVERMDERSLWVVLQFSAHTNIKSRKYTITQTQIIYLNNYITVDLLKKYIKDRFAQIIKIYKGNKNYVLSL